MTHLRWGAGFVGSALRCRHTFEGEDAMGLVGRERKVALLRALLVSSRRLVAVTGPAGVGKSALLRAIVTAPPDDSEIWTVDLGGVPASAEVWVEVAARLGLGARAGESRARIAERIGASAVTLLLDHLDSLTVAPAELRALLDACPRLRIVITVRGTFESADAEVPVRPLGIPEERMPIDRALGCASIALFVDAAARSDAGFALDGENLDSVIRICRLVGGLPLALQLAAARIRVFSSERVANDLADGGPALELLRTTRDGREVGVGHALAATVGALSEDDRRMLRSLAHFERAFSFAGVVDVSGQAPGDAADALERLLDLRLLDSAPPLFGEPVFMMLPILRSVLRELPGDPPTEDAYRRRLARVVREAADAHAQAEPPSHRAFAHVLHQDLLHEGDLLLERHDPRAHSWVLDCAAALEGTAEVTRISGQLEHLIATADLDSLPLTQQAQTWIWSAYGLAMSADGAALADLVDERWRRGFRLIDAERTPLLALQALMVAVIMGITTGDMPATVRAARTGSRLAREHACATWGARFDVWVAAGIHADGDAPGAVRLAMDALRHAQRVGDPYSILTATILLRTVPPDTVPADAAVPTLADALRLARDERDAVMEWFILAVMTRAELAAELPARAARRCAERLSIGRAWWGSYLSAISLVHTVFIAVAMEDWAFAARMLGAIEADRERVLRSMAPASALELAQVRALLTARLGESGFAAVAAEGGILSAVDATAQALRWLREHSEESPTAPGSGDGLTAREREVLVLLAEGLSNKQIAERLFITPKTTMHHSSAIYRKLDVRSRAEATAFAHRHGLVETRAE
ncbi:LuxR C-terminal-related transcriptional regulator [Microbacterium bovistercoris]|nr:LuxR C-terminal-related transcriptional regulator [Microbacterium bovistercoris]